MRRLETPWSPASARTRRRFLGAGLLLACTVGLGTAGAATTAPVLPTQTPLARMADLADTLTEVYAAFCAPVKSEPPAVPQAGAPAVAPAVPPIVVAPLGYVERHCVVLELSIEGLQGEIARLCAAPNAVSVADRTFCPVVSPPTGPPPQQRQ